MQKRMTLAPARASVWRWFCRWSFGIGAVALSAVVTPALASRGAETTVRPQAVAVLAPPTARQLLAKVRTCSQISNGRYATDDGGKRIIPVCGGVTGAVFWKADMDIDCDGVVTAHCNDKTDPTFLPGTALEPGGKPLNAETNRYMVIPQGSGTFNYSKHNITLGAVVAIIYKGKVTYAVFGDTGPKHIIGEASYATAKMLGINPNPAVGGADSGVTYIVFKATKVANPRSNRSIDSAGKAAAARFLDDN
jgi:Fungal chitosanase of glycosyl hydrolase group 75